jgi:hypothetical protein
MARSKQVLARETNSLRKNVSNCEAWGLPDSLVEN